MRKTKKAVLVTIMALSAAAMTATVLAQGGGRPNPDQTAVGFRQALMTVIGGTAIPLILMQRGRVPYNAERVAKGAADLTTLAGMIPDAFMRNTSSASVKTTALPLVWQDHDEFLKNAAELKTRVEALDKASKGGNEAEVKTAIMNVGAVCNDCHMKFRTKPPGGEGGGR